MQALLMCLDTNILCALRTSSPLHLTITSAYIPFFQSVAISFCQSLKLDRSGTQRAGSCSCWPSEASSAFLRDASSACHAIAALAIASRVATHKHELSANDRCENVPHFFLIASWLCFRVVCV